MKSIPDMIRPLVEGLKDKSRSLWSSLSRIKISIPYIVNSSRKINLHATKEYYRKYSTRRKELEASSNENKDSRRLKTVSVALAAVVCLVAVAGASVAYSSQKAFAVKVNGRQVALVLDKVGAERVLEDLKKEQTKQWRQNLMIREKVEFAEVEARKYQLDEITELKEILNENLSFQGVATGIKANGKMVAVVKDNESANKVLEAIKNKFTEDLKNIKPESIGIKENIEIVETPANLSTITEVDQVVEKLINGEEKAKVHVVKEGDSLWTIARKNDTRVAVLKAANPSLKGDNPKLDIGQEIKLIKTEPLITVLVTAEATVKETIPYKVKVTTDKSMWKGKQTVKEKGENGSREVKYKLVYANGVQAEKEVLEEKILKPAKDQVVVRGAKLVVASRGGSGQLAWPTNGKITSKFGRRWGSMHTGLDIDGYTGQPVGAAEDGKVVSAGWDGAYGKQVTIDHGNGMKTKYAHLSAINVSVGDKVSRGELIGKVGNTGRSYGSHLHFEVKIGGSFRNPISYLK